MKTGRLRIPIAELIPLLGFMVLGATTSRADTTQPSWTCSDIATWVQPDAGSQGTWSEPTTGFTYTPYTVGIVPPQRYIPLSQSNVVPQANNYPNPLYPTQEWSDYFAPYYNKYNHYLLNVLKPDPSVDLCGHTNIAVVPGMVYASSVLKSVNGTFGYGTYNLLDERLVGVKKSGTFLTGWYGVQTIKYLRGGIIEDEFAYDSTSSSTDNTGPALNPAHPERVYSSYLTGRYITVNDFNGPGCTIVMADDQGGSSTFSCENRTQWAKSLNIVEVDPQDVQTSPGSEGPTDAGLSTYYFLKERVYPNGEKEIRHYVNETTQPEDYLDYIYYTGPAPSGQNGAPIRHINFTYAGQHRNARVKTMTVTNDNSDVGASSGSGSGASAPASNAVTLTFTYDSTNRFLTNVTSSTGDQTSFSYDAKGRITSVQTPTGSVDYSFYPTDQVSKIMGPVTVGSTPFTQTYAYNYVGSEFDTSDQPTTSNGHPVIRVSNNIDSRVTYYSTTAMMRGLYDGNATEAPQFVEEWDNQGHKYAMKFNPNLTRPASPAGPLTLNTILWPYNLLLSSRQVDNDLETFTWASGTTTGRDNLYRFLLTSRKVGPADGSSPAVLTYKADTFPSASGALDFLHNTITDPVTGLVEMQTFDDSGWRTCDGVLAPSGVNGATFCENLSPTAGTYGKLTTCPTFPHPIAAGQSINCTVQDFGVDQSGSLLPPQNYQVTYSQNYAGGRIASVVTPAGTVSSDDLTTGGSQTITAAFPNGAQLFSETMNSGLFGVDTDTVWPLGQAAGQGSQLQASVQRYANGAISSGTLPDGSQMQQSLDSTTGIPDSLSLTGAFGVNQSANSPLDGLGLPSTVTTTLGQSITETLGRNVAPYTSALPAGTTAVNLPLDLCDPASPNGRNGLGPAAKCGDDGKPYVCRIVQQAKDQGEPGKPWTSYAYVQYRLDNDNPNLAATTSSYGVSQCYTQPVTIPTPFDGWVTINMPAYAVGITSSSCCTVQCGQALVPQSGCAIYQTLLTCANDGSPSTCTSQPSQSCDTNSTIVAQACGGLPECPPPPTNSPTPSPTDTSSPSPSPTDTSSPSPSPTDTSSPSPSPTDTSSPSPSPTDTSSPSPSPTDTSSPSPSPVDTSSPSPSPISSCTGTPPTLTPEETVGCCNGTYVTCLQPQFGGPAAGCCSLSSSSPSPSP